MTAHGHLLPFQLPMEILPASQVPQLGATKGQGYSSVGHGWQLPWALPGAYGKPECLDVDH